ncbi:MAG: hypothetical protein ACR5LD_10075 [Symbiopectobacterium sp.]
MIQVSERSQHTCNLKYDGDTSSLALDYSPGVAAPCLEIAEDPLADYKYTARGNLVAVVSNGTAVIGLGNIGALAGKPVMEGKGVLFIEKKLRECMKILVFHDDQHGTAIICTAAVLNGLRVVRKNISEVPLVVSGADAAFIACLNLLVGWRLV